MQLRTRKLRAGFFSSEQVIGCSFAARILFAGLWCAADKEGRLEDRPAQIKLAVFPDQRVDIAKLLDEVAAQRLIVRYEVEGKKCIWIPNFVEHQNPHPHEASSRLPACNYIPPNSPTIPDVITSNEMLITCNEQVI